jgi:hypothetical protein
MPDDDRGDPLAEDPHRRPAGLLSVRHSPRAEAAGALTLYGLYELARSLVDADTADADDHAHRVVTLERSLHLLVKANVQRAVQTLPGSRACSASPT